MISTTVKNTYGKICLHLSVYLSERKRCRQDCWISQVLPQLCKLVVVPDTWEDWDKIIVMLTGWYYAQEGRKKVVPQTWAKEKVIQVLLSVNACGYQVLCPSYLELKGFPKAFSVVEMYPPALVGPWWWRKADQAVNIWDGLRDRMAVLVPWIKKCQYWIVIFR